MDHSSNLPPGACRCPAKATTEPDAYDLSTEVALFRYGLIAQLIHDPPPKGQQEAQLRALAAKTYQLPGSSRTRVSLSALRRYLKAYRDGGFEALRPAGRPDAGTPRAFPPEVLAKAIALRVSAAGPHHPDAGRTLAA